MTLRLIRRIAIVLLAFYAVGQASVALAACGMDRGVMAQSMAMPGGDACDDCVKVASDAVTVTCIAHCTADLQLAASEPVSIPDAVYAALPSAPKARVGTGPPVSAQALAASVPRRILLHSFQI
jgi:hypothetical protein